MYQCYNCGGELRFDIPSQRLVCTSCSSDFDPYAVEKPEDAAAETYASMVFHCPQCGGEIMSQDTTAAAFCSYCGASTVLSQHIVNEKRPRYIIPFKVNKERCKELYASKMKRSIFAPKELRDPKFVDSFRGIYMPYWSYEILHHGPFRFHFDKSHRKGDYIITDHYAFNGNLHAEYNGLSHDASSTFADTISEALAPYDVKEMVDFTPSYLCGYYADTEDVDSRTYEDQVQDTAAAGSLAYIEKNGPPGAVFKDPDKKSPAKYHAVLKGTTMTLFPVWFLSYRRRDRVAYATVNGQTGKVVSDIPISIGKYILATLVLAVPIFFLLEAFLTLVPKVVMSIAALLALVAAAMFRMQLSMIKKKETEEFPVYDHSSEGKREKARRRVVHRSSGNASGFMAVLAILMFAVPVLMVFGSLIYTLSRTFIIPVLSIIGILLLSGSFKKVKKLRATGSVWGIFLGLFAFIVMLAVWLISPAKDAYYYFASVAAIAAIMLMMISVMQYHNIYATRELPQFANYKGGDNRA